MAHSETLRKTLLRIDGRGYKAYKDIEGAYEFPGFVLFVDHVQGDPFASPSRVRLRVPISRTGLDGWLYANHSREVALRDFLTRQFSRSIRKVAKGNRGIGKSGLISIDTPGQEILERSSVVLGGGHLEVRFVMGLPAAGRTILAKEAAEMFFNEIPKIVELSLVAKNLDTGALHRHVACAEDQDAMRAQLKEMSLVAFLANGSILPRLSGVDDRPLSAEGAQGQKVIPFQSPDSLQVELNRPNGGPVTGMGIPKGVTLIVGGGFHGKSTLLQAVERSVYNHIPGDGRENVVTISSAVKIKAEDGRYVAKVDISPFIQNLPFGRDTRSFSTENASGSTSQAANIMEALEMGAELLLIDEDTSATNFMIRDERMQALVSKDKEPITPFLDKVRQLLKDHGVSTILVMGGSGDYFDVADNVIMMDHYRPVDVLEEVRSICQRYRSNRRPEGGPSFGKIPSRTPRVESFQARRGKREVKIDAKGLRRILYGVTEIDLAHVEQLVDISQTRAIGELIHAYATRYASSGMALREGLERLFGELNRGGFDAVLSRKMGNLAVPRVFEVAAAINRMRSLRVD
jgi:predicted ABC-class ATPase